MLLSNPTRSRRTKPAPADAIAAVRPHPGRRLTEREFVARADQETRAEWAGGAVVTMAPVSGEQSDLLVWLVKVIGLFVDARDLGTVRGPEFTVRLGRLRRRRVPDLMFLAKARAHLLRPTFVEGPPDLILEIVGPDSPSRDYREKYNEYEAAGVREYWLVNPMAQSIEAYALRRKKYQAVPVKDEQIGSKVLPGFHLKPSWLFRGPTLLPARVLRELGIRR